MLGWSISALAGLLPLAIALPLWRRLNTAGLVAGAIAAASTWLALFYRADFGKLEGYGFPEPQSPLARILPFLPPLHPAWAVALCSLVAMLALTLLTDPPREPMLDKILLRLKPLPEADKPTVTGSGTEEKE